MFYLPSLILSFPSTGLVVLVLVFLSCAYVTTESQSETIAAEKLVGFHKKLQQVNDFEPVRFLPVKYIQNLYLLFLTIYVVLLFRSSTSRNFDDGDKHKEEFLEAVHVQNEAIKNIADDDNIEYDHELVHELVHQHKAPAIQEYNIRDNNVPVYFPNSDMNQRLNQDYIPFNQKKQTPYIPEHRLVHFDLKGAPPSIDYMKKVVTLSKKLGATGVLIEYEDMFPWTGR